MRRLFIAMLALSALLAAGCSAKDAKSGAAGKYPEKSVTVIVPFNAGSNTDRQIRFIQPYLEKALGANIVVVNKGGASGTIGVTDYLSQKPDGYTILFSLPTPTVYKPASGDTEYKPEDLIPVARVSTAAMYLAVRSDSEYKTGADLIAFIKDHPGDFTYANAGNGGIAHLAFATFLNGEKLEAISVPFTGGTAECYTAVMGGHVKSYVPGEQDLVGRSDVRPLINLGSKSDTEGFSSVPTLEDLGYKGYSINNFSGFYFMKGIDASIVDKFDKAVAKALSDPDFLAAAKAAKFSYNYAKAADFSSQVKATVQLIKPVFEMLGKAK